MLRKSLPLMLSLLLLPVPALAEINTGDTAWMLISTALVLIMTPGLAFFYGGMVRSKNAASTLYQNFIPLGVIGLLWVVIGFSLAFSTPEGSSFIGDTSKMMLAGVGQEPDVSYPTIPSLLFMMFQMMFAIITPALMTGAFAERVNFKAWIAILILWSLAVYCPVAHWVWASTGWLYAKGAQDFAGGFVVHMTAGFSALAAAIFFGKRRDFGTAHKPHDLGQILLGTTLLWFGWFGFNAGSAVSSGGLAVQAFTTTFLSAAAAMLTWTLVDALKDGKPTLMGGCIGVVAGLVATTPAAGYVTADSAMVIGLMTGVLCNIVARIVKGTFKIDDTLDVFACHGVGGLFGAIMTGILATSSVNSASKDGSWYGNDSVLMANLTGAGAVAIYSVVVTLIILVVVNAVCKVRVTDSNEEIGLDISQHGEKVNSVV